MVNLAQIEMQKGEDKEARRWLEMAKSVKKGSSRKITYNMYIVEKGDSEKKWELLKQAYEMSC